MTSAENPAPRPVLELQSVSFRYAAGCAEVLDRLTLTVAEGSFTYIRGQSGAGKSTLLKLAYFGIPPTEGVIRIFGQDMAKLPREDLPAFRRRIGVVFQDFCLMPHLSAFDNVALPLVVAGVSHRRIDRDVRELLEWVGLGNRHTALPATLSGGEQQRLAIARAVITRPKLLIADEPTGNVDDRMATRLMYLFEELNRLGTTILMATHNDTLAARFIHPHIRLDNGRISCETPLAA
jgi:cell division transport system ATP-binding protein